MPMENLIKLSEAYNKPLFIFDLETTTFPYAKTFGITEIGALIIKPDGKIIKKQSLVNPENPIHPVASKLTGISQAMVDREPNYPSTDWHRFFCHAAKTAIVIGFNHLSFDIPGIFKTTDRYGLEPCHFEACLDVYEFTTGNLSANGRRYGISVGNAHRAMADVITTAKVLDFKLGEGLDPSKHFKKMNYMQRAEEINLHQFK